MRPLIKPVFLLSLFILHLLTAPAALASSQSVTQQASGYGDSPDTAVANALLEAARQVLGVTVSLDPEIRTAVLDLVVTQSAGVATLHGTSFSEPIIETATFGNIKSYKVQSLETVSSELWVANIEAEVLKYQNKGEDRSHLTSIVITPFRVLQPTYKLGEHQVNAWYARNRLNTYLVNEFSKSGRFRVLDRRFGNEAEKEEKIIEEKSVDPNQHLKLGQQLGADYILTGEIEDFSLGTKDKQYYGAKFTNLKPRFRVNYRLIETATREVLWADTFIYDTPESILRNRIRNEEIDIAQEPELLADLIYPDVARSIAGEVIDTLYPIRVIGFVGATEVYINQGDNRVKPEEQLSLHQETKQVKDPDTGLTIHIRSAPLATIEVTEVSNHYAKGKVVDGDITAVTVNAVLRNMGADESAPDAPPARKTPGSSEAPIQW